MKIPNKILGSAAFLTILAAFLTYAAVNLIEAPSETASQQKSDTDPSVIAIKDDIHNFDKDAFINSVEENLKLEVYATVPINGQNLHTVFTTKGTFTIDTEVTIALKGKVIDLRTGENILASNLASVESEITSKLEKRNAIADFTSRGNAQLVDKSKSIRSTHPDKAHNSQAETQPTPQKNIELPMPPLSQQNTEPGSNNTSKLNASTPTANGTHDVMKQKVVELSDDAFSALKKQVKPINMAEVMANQKARQYPGTQELIKRQSEAKLRQQQTALAEGKINEMTKVPSEQSNSDSVMTMLKNLPQELRKKHGPKFAPKLLPNIADEQFIVYEPSDGVEYRGTLTVATDFTCPFCKKLHYLIPTLNDEGVRVRYMPYPRKRIINYQFSPNFTVDEYIARTKTEPMNQIGQLVTAAYCSLDNSQAFDQLFAKKSLDSWPAEISSQCEAVVREYKILGDLMFSGATPYMVWGDKDTPEENRGFIRGLDRHEKSINQLLHRLES